MNLFYRLVQKQRRNRGSTDHMLFDNKLVSGEDLHEAWASYFEKLETPVLHSEYNEEHLHSVNLQNEMARETSNGADDGLLHVTPECIRDIVTKLKCGKAADIYGLSTEHLQYADPVVYKIISHIVNRILGSGDVPQQFKLGVVTPVYKKKKSILDPDNYRRITITPIVAKVFEKVIVAPLKKILQPKISKLQRGFCEHSSSANTAFLLSEAIAEAKDADEPLYAAYLDASKAFDVVWHAGMLASLQRLGVNGMLWLTIASLYDGMTSRVKMANSLSRAIREGQGVRQGGIPSTELFKSRGHQALDDLERSGQGFAIGLVDVSSPTCADDMTLLANSTIGLQRLLTIAEVDATMERYQFSKTKSKVMVFGKPSHTKMWHDDPTWTLNGENLGVAQEEVHLGLTRTPCNKATRMVQENIKKARRSAYSLMNAGLYGMNGVHPRIGIKLWKTCVLPILLFGLEGRRLNVADSEQLEKFQRLMLRNIMHLPKATATPALHILSGVLPVKALLDRQTLTQCVNFLRDADTKESQIIRRQMAVKGMDSHSYVVLVRELLAEYDLPSVFVIAEDTPSKYAWKKKVTDKINKHWIQALRDDANLMSSLKYMCVDSLKVGAMHAVWTTNNDTKAETLRACNKAKILVGRYYLETDYARFSRSSPSCKLCGCPLGDLQHFVLSCPALSTARDHYLQKIYSIAINLSGKPDISSTWFMQVILDVQVLEEEMAPETIAEVNELSKLLLLKLHKRRSAILQPAPSP